MQSLSDAAASEDVTYTIWSSFLHSLAANNLNKVLRFELEMHLQGQIQYYYSNWRHFKDVFGIHFGALYYFAAGYWSC